MAQSHVPPAKPEAELWTAQSGLKTRCHLKVTLVVVQIQLIIPFICFFLFFDIEAHFFLILAHCRHPISSRSEMLPLIVLLSSFYPSWYLDRTLPLDVTYYLHDRILRRDTHQYMHLVSMQMPFFHFTFFLTRKLSQYFSQILPYLAIDQLTPVLRYPHQVILAIPSRMSYTSYGHFREPHFWVRLERFTLGKFSFFRGTVKLFESPSRAGGLPKSMIRP